MAAMRKREGAISYIYNIYTYTYDMQHMLIDTFCMILATADLFTDLSTYPPVLFSVDYFRNPGRARCPRA